MAKKKQRPRKQKPDAAEKQNRKAYLTALGVSPSQAEQLSGVGEDVSREELIRRRIEWQRTLQKSG